MRKMTLADKGSSRRSFLAQVAGSLAALGMSGVARLFAGTPRPAARAARVGSDLSDADALFFVVADTHSAYERYPQLLAAFDAVRARYPDIPLATLFNGDLFERGNVVALRGAGRVDLALVEALARRAPLVFNLGNHEAALVDLGEAVRQLGERGATVISNAIEARTGRPFAAPAVSLELGGVRVDVRGLATSDLTTYRAEVRPSLRVPAAASSAEAQRDWPAGDGRVRIVLSHAGTLADRGVLPLLPDGALLVGGHDHVRYTHRAGETLYVHTGWWAESVALVGVRRRGNAIAWLQDVIALERTGQQDPHLAELVAAEETTHLRAEDRVVIGRTSRELSFGHAALFAAEAVRDAAGADVGMIGNTTFGTGLPAGPIERHRFDAFVRFDGGVQRATVDGPALRAIMRRANQSGRTPFEQRTGEYVIATPLDGIDPARRYTLATVDWVRLHADRYLGTNLDFEPVTGVRLKDVVQRRLADRSARAP